MGSGASNLTLSSDILSQLKVQAEKPNDVSDTTNYIDEIIKIRTLLSTSGLEKINEFQSEFEKPIDGSDIQTDDDAKAELISIRINLKKKLFIQSPPPPNIKSTIDHSEMDTHATKNVPTFKKIDKLVDYLIKPFKGDEYKIARTIYRWITDNIKYDRKVAIKKPGEKKLKKFDLHHAHPDVVYERRVTVCAGYCALLKEMLKLAKIKCESISGVEKAFSHKPGTSFHDMATGAGHMWNTIYINNKWYLCDVTWASGSAGVKDRDWHKDYEDLWWCCPPSIFYHTHFPYDKDKNNKEGDDSNKKVELESTKDISIQPQFDGEFYSKQKFCLAPYFTSEIEMLSPQLQYCTFDVKNESNSNNNANQLTSNEPLCLTMTTPQDCIIMAKAYFQKNGNKRDGDSSIMIQQHLLNNSNNNNNDGDRRNEVQIYCKFPTKGKYVLKIFANSTNATLKQDDPLKKTYSEVSYDLCCEYLINVVDTIMKYDFPKLFEQWLENDMQFIHTKDNPLFKSSHLQLLSNDENNNNNNVHFQFMKGDSNRFKRNTPDFNEIHIVLNDGDLGDMLKYDDVKKEFNGTLRLTKQIKIITLGTITESGQLRQLIRWWVGNNDNKKKKKKNANKKHGTKKSAVVKKKKI